MFVNLYSVKSWLVLCNEQNLKFLYKTYQLLTNYRFTNQLLKWSLRLFFFCGDFNGSIHQQSLRRRRRRREVIFHKKLKMKFSLVHMIFAAVCVVGTNSFSIYRAWNITLCSESGKAIAKNYQLIFKIFRKKFLIFAMILRSKVRFPREL